MSASRVVIVSVALSRPACAARTTGRLGGSVAAPTARAALRRPPVTLRPPRAAGWSTVALMRSASAEPRRPTCAATRAAAPATYGEAIEVPSRDWYVEVGYVERIAWPGAKRSTVLAP